MSYLKRWRHYTVEIQALAAESSDDGSGAVSEAIADAPDSPLREEHNSIHLTDADQSSINDSTL